MTFGAMVLADIASAQQHGAFDELTEHVCLVHVCGAVRPRIADSLVGPDEALSAAGLLPVFDRMKTSDLNFAGPGPSESRLVARESWGRELCTVLGEPLPPVARRHFDGRGGDLSRCCS